MKGLSIGLVTLLLLFGISSSVMGQRSSRSDEKVETSAFQEKFWWGANLGLQFSGGFGQSYFITSLEPMLGYKIDERGNFSIGPRLSAEYSSIRFAQNTDKVNSFNFGGGLFGRAKIYRGYFAHVEYEKVNQKRAVTNAFNQVFINADGSVQTERVWQDNYFIGGGIRQGGDRVAFEVLILFNLRPDDNNGFNQDPIEYRTGFTVNF